MRVAISIEHPAWAHQFRHIIERINKDGETLVITVDKDGDLKLLDAFGIKYVTLANTTGKNVIEKGWLFIKLCIAYTREISKFKPDVLIGRASPMMAVAAWITKKPHIIFEDTEVSKFSLKICKKFSTKIITPENFLTELGDKQIRLPVYKELFYLHKREFVPNKNRIERYGIDTSKPYAVVRFISWNASHDVGIDGISDSRKTDFINNLLKICNVYISSEAGLPEELTKYELNIPFEDIHHVLYYAAVVISEGASMASEAAILGTHSFYLNEIASGTTEEQEKKYHILSVLHYPETRYDIALKETEKLLKTEEFWEDGKKTRERLLKDMPNPNDVFWNLVKEYAE